MKIVFDECIPQELASECAALDVTTVSDLGWTELKNGILLEHVSRICDIFVSIDQGIPFQQNFGKYNIAIVILRVPNNRIDTIRSFIPALIEALPTVTKRTIKWITGPPKNWRG